jgi:hypothetical protein
MVWERAIYGWMLGIFFERRKNEKGSVRFWHT